MTGRPASAVPLAWRRPEEMLFADDSVKNVAGAGRVGLGGHVYVNADTLAGIIQEGRIAAIKRIALSGWQIG